MGERDRGAIAKGLERLLTRGVEPDRDGDLLERFHQQRDQDAFEALVVRHGPMVRGVCRRLLRDPADADDAFQATFLVLARKGAGLRDPDRLGPWLYGVAARVAAKARARSARRRTRPLVDDLPARDDDRAEWSDVMAIIDAEVVRLPTSQRDVLVACLLNGLTEQEAARAFDRPVGTIKSRLSRARETLRARLVRRGIAPASALAAASSPESFASAASAPLLRATLSLVAAPAAVPRSVAALTSGVASTMLSKILATTAIVACAAGALGLAATAWTADPPPAPQAAPPARAPAPPQIRVELDRNLKTILLALVNYQAANEGFPPPAVLSPDGRPLLSWRVLILPYLDQKELYDQFHLDEPWDGPHNRTLIARMPAVFQTPGFPTAPGKTRIRGVNQIGTIFGPPPPNRTAPNEAGMSAMMGAEAPAKQADQLEQADPVREAPPNEPRSIPRGIGFQEITDGTSLTAALVVAQEAVEWTRPVEMAKLAREVGWVKDGKATTYTEDYWPLMDTPEGYILGMVDGTVRRVPQTAQPMTLSALLTYAGGEVVDSRNLSPPSPQVGAVERLSPADFDRRLHRVEEKLDAILDRLDALAPPNP